MSTVRILRDLWRLRLYVAGVCVVALLAGTLVAYHTFPPKSQSYTSGVATAQVLVDTPQSQVVGDASTVTANGAQTLGTLGTQANLLADLMVEGTIKADIAQRAGIRVSQLTGISTAVTVPSASGSGVGPSSVSVPSGPDVYALTTQILTDDAEDTTLPIIEINAYAPNRAKAIQLANAAAAGLQDFMSSEAADERIPNADRLKIMNLGLSQATSETHGSSPVIGFGVALAILLLGCAWVRRKAPPVRGSHRTTDPENLRFEEPGPLDEDAEWAHLELSPSVDPARGPVIAANGVVSGNTHADPASRASYADFPTIGDTPGQDHPAMSARRWSPPQI